VVLVFAAVLVIALGETAGAAMSKLRPRIDQFARARIEANRDAHGLTGAAEYDDEVVGRAVWTAEAGLSFMHTHAEGVGPLVLLAGTLAATLVRPRLARAALHALFTLGTLFPLGYLVYGLAVLEVGRDDGVALAERYALTPLGSAVIAGLVLLLALVRGGRAPADAPALADRP
jgi:hypothetical protein